MELYPICSFIHCCLWDSPRLFHVSIMCPFSYCLTILLLLLLLSRFSRVRLCATPETAAYQAPLSLGFSRQEHWSGLPFPSPMHESEKWKWSRSVVSTLRDPMDCSLPGSSIHEVFQARVLEWGAIAFSAINTYRGKKERSREEPLGFPNTKILHEFQELRPNDRG